MRKKDRTVDALGIVRDRRSLRGLALVLGILAALPAETVRAQGRMQFPQIWTGRMVVPDGVVPGETGDSFELRIFKTSTDTEVAELVAALRQGGQMGLRNAMFQLQPKGWIRIGNLAATDAVVLRVADLPDGRRRVRFICDHPLRLYDKSDPAGSNAHPFAYLELIADASGNGDGSLVASASLAMDEDELKMETAGLPVIQVYDVTTDTPPARRAKAAPADR